MKTYIVILLVIVVEACALTWLFSAENSQLKKENGVLKHQLAYQKDKNEELQWFITKMELVMAGKTVEEIFQSEKVETPENDKINDKDDNEDVIYID